MRNSPPPPRRSLWWSLAIPLVVLTTLPLVASQLGAVAPAAGLIPATDADQAVASLGALAASADPRLDVADAEFEPELTPEPQPVASPTMVPTAIGPTAIAPTADVPAAPGADAQPTPTLAPTPEPAPATPTTVPANDGPPRIGLQVGHWRSDELPEELSRLRGATGGSGGGVREVDLNLVIAQRLAERLRARGYLVDVLPATVPPGYRADLFLAIDADASNSSNPRGYKLARSRWSRLPATDDQLVRTISRDYGEATDLPWSDAITRNMTGYYAFNNRRRVHAIDKHTPAVIIELGYLTNPADRVVLLNQADQVIAEVERGLVRFLDERPPADQREQPATTGLTIVINDDGAIARAAPNVGAPALATIEAGRRYEAPELLGEWYGIWVADVNGPGWVHQSQATLVTITLP